MSGRVALVTGGSRGIGRATAIALARDGHRVAVCWSSDADGGDATVKEIEAEGGEGLSVQADVADPAAVDAAFTTVEQQWEPVTVLVNNAGVTADGLLMRMKDEAWSRVMRTNVDGSFHTIRRATPGMMKARFGRIVNVGSVAGLMGSAGQANYAAAKGALVGLTRSVAREMASRGITCNLVTPGPIRTAMLEAVDEARQADLTALVPLARL
ncbi:MAG TPA: SDR family NAD(P)-dependent oxidoreductase, partial [Acidimicrobiales bacterium]|nr:SDR family NAD(P)-dependent oxidoreductase [Acidimicrobiales bacterium]